MDNPHIYVIAGWIRTAKIKNWNKIRTRTLKKSTPGNHQIHAKVQATDHTKVRFMTHITIRSPQQHTSHQHQQLTTKTFSLPHSHRRSAGGIDWYNEP